MPTGYTAILTERDDVTFEEFAWRCARAFGALVEFRDVPIDVPIPKELKASDYHLKAQVTAKAQLEQFESLSASEQYDFAVTEIAKERARREQSRNRTSAENARYETMLKRVREWWPPSAEHQGLKEFMEQQLTASLSDPYEVLTEADPNAWVRGHLKQLRRSVEYHETEHKAELERVASRNLWLSQLRASLGGPK